MIVKRTAGALVACLVIGCFLPAVGHAEWFGSADGSERVKATLERTDQVIQRAVESLRDCASARGKALLEEARELQSKAWERYLATDSTVPPELILKMTGKARDLAVSAIETCQLEFKAHEALRSLLDSTGELAREASGTVEIGSSPEARRLLEAGLRQLDQAREEYRAGEYRKAITLAGTARNLIQRAMQRAQTGFQEQGLSRVTAALDRTDLLIADVFSSAGASDDPKVTSLLDRARDEQEKAREFLARGHAAQAMARTQSARATALDALWLLQRAPRSDRIQAALDLVETLYRELAPEIRESGGAEANVLLEKAGESLAAARDHLRAGDNQRAAQAARLADSLLRRASEKSGGR